MHLEPSAARIRITLATCLGIAGVAIAGCAEAGSVVVEVLPPRTSITCAAPARTDPALGRGVLDVLATEDHHGGYVADLRLSSTTTDAHVTGVTVEYDLPDGAASAVSTAATKASGDVVVGDVLLLGEDEDLRQAVLQEVELLPRAFALVLADDDSLALSQTEFARVGVTITPIIEGSEGVAGLEAKGSGFAIDVCKGCLIDPPAACPDEGESARNLAVCRPGQDTPSFSCVQAQPGVP